MIGRLVLITGAQAAGKTTLGRALARLLPRAVHVDGDVIHGFVVSGEVPFDMPPPEGAIEQLHLRYRGSLAVADVYRAKGFDAVITDNIYGRDLIDLVDEVLRSNPGGVHVVVLDPDVEAVKTRELGRAKTGYSPSITPEMLVAAVRRETPLLGLRLDTSGQTVEESAARLLDRLDDALVTDA